MQYVFGGICGPNRDPTVFDKPNEFNPARPDLYKLLSWNGALEDPAKFPRFCPGQELSMIMIKTILGCIDELKGARFDAM